MRLTRTNLGADADTLLELRKALDKKGLESAYLNTRLEYQEVSQCLTHYMPHFAGCAKCKKFPWDHERSQKIKHNFVVPERVTPGLLPTQASLRWSVTDPPLVTCSHPYLDPPTRLQSEVVLPDPETVWVCFDYDAIEAKIVAAYSDDEEDLDAFDKGHDIHTITSCKMFGDPLPLNLINPHTSPECAEWREARNWQGKDDKRRGLAKVRYCVYYGKDHKAAEDSGYAKEFVRRGGNRAELVEAARLFLKSKPNLVACKKKWWAICAKRCEARTEFGHRRRLFGDEWERSKVGWNHMVQGFVSNILDIALIDINAAFPFSHLVYPSHDAAKIQLSNFEYKHPDTLAKFKKIVEREWTINKHTFTSTAGWFLRWPDGSKEAI